MSEQAQDITVYRVMRGNILIPRSAGKVLSYSDRSIHQGDLLPQDIFTSKDIQGWLEDGRIAVEYGLTLEQVEVIEDAIVERNRFQVDPASLVGKSMEELMLMIFDIDEDFDTEDIESEQDAVILLTSGWKGLDTQIIAPVTDKASAEALKLNDLQQSHGLPATSTSTPQMSAEAQEALSAAKARAQAPAPE